MEEKIRTDARTIRTKTLIRRVLEEMIVEMDARSITVGELTGRAGIHRKTFYLHYGTIDDLYRELADDIAQGMYRIVDRMFESDREFDFGVGFEA